MQLLRIAAAVWFAVAVIAPAGAQEPPRLSLPLVCEPGRTCFLQHYVDVAPDAGSLDYHCGHATYDGHTGVDFRLLSAAAAKAGVSVVASAPGVVKGRRDGMADAFARETGKAGIKGMECGNGVVVDHGGGWETQYCHMRTGSVRVAVGAQVARGAVLGEVGYSGLADTAHLHFTVRQNGKVVDPFTAKTPTGACAREPDAAVTGLFDETVARAFPYADGDFLQIGFASRVLGWAELEADHAAGQDLKPDSPALVFFARLTHPRGGDRIALTVTGPGGFAVDNAGNPIDRNKAIYLVHGGRKRAAGRWPAGVYQGEARLVRDGKVIRSARASFTMP